jgi:hypothetical protein
MGTADDYQKKADQCLRMANTAKDADEKATWLQIAEGWLRLLEDARCAPSAMQITTTVPTDDDRH